MFTKIQLTGTLAQDFDVRQGPRANFLVGSLAVNGAYDNTTKVMDYQAEAEFYNLVIFYDSLISKAKYFKKGFIVNITGTLSRDKYLSKNGEICYRSRITVEEINPQVQGEELAQAISQAILDFKAKRQSQNGFNQTQNSFNQSQSSGFIQPTKSSFGQGQTNGFGQGNSFGQSNSFGYNNNANNGFGHNPNSFSNPNSSFNQTASQPNKPTDNPNGFANTQNGFNQSQSANNQNGFNQQQEDQNPLSYNQFKQPMKQDNNQVQTDIIKNDDVPF